MDLSDVVGAIRRHWRIVAGAMVIAVVAVGLYNFTRVESRAPTRFRAQAVLTLPATAPDPDTPTREQEEPPANLPPSLLTGQQTMATSQEVRAAALDATGLPPNDGSVSFSNSLSERGVTLVLRATAREPQLAEAAATNYADAFVEARTAVTAEYVLSSREAALESIQNLEDRLSAVEGELRGRIGTLPPIATSEDAEVAPVVEVPAGANVETTAFLFERNELLNQLNQSYSDEAKRAVESVQPSPFATISERLPPQRIVAKQSSPVVPSAVILLAGALIGIVGAIVADRRDHSVRSARTVATVLSAPVLATVPPRRRSAGTYSVLEHPGSRRSEAFRTLAATTVTTDRLPKAIMVTSPRGETHEYVAANFAAALADLGLQVALVATSTEQSWYLDPFTAPAEGAMNLPELLALAHAGGLNGEVRRRLPLTELSPNLVVVPPGDVDDLRMPLDGLPPFLETMASNSFDVTVIAGPPLLGDANATIVAWATRSVLWAVQVGELKREDAAAAATRLELAGVDPFGIVVVGSEET